MKSKKLETQVILRKDIETIDILSNNDSIAIKTLNKEMDKANTSIKYSLVQNIQEDMWYSQDGILIKMVKIDSPTKHVGVFIRIETSTRDLLHESAQFSVNYEGISGLSKAVEYKFIPVEAIKNDACILDLGKIRIFRTKPSNADAINGPTANIFEYELGMTYKGYLSEEDFNNGVELFTTTPIGSFRIPTTISNDNKTKVVCKSKSGSTGAFHLTVIKEESFKHLGITRTRGEISFSEVDFTMRTRKEFETMQQQIKELEKKLHGKSTEIMELKKNKVKQTALFEKQLHNEKLRMNKELHEQVIKFANEKEILSQLNSISKTVNDISNTNMKALNDIQNSKMKVEADIENSKTATRGKLTIEKFNSRAKAKHEREMSDRVHKQNIKHSNETLDVKLSHEEQKFARDMHKQDVEDERKRIETIRKERADKKERRRERKKAETLVKQQRRNEKRKVKHEQLLFEIVQERSEIEFQHKLDMSEQANTFTLGENKKMNNAKLKLEKKANKQKLEHLSVAEREANTLRRNRASEESNIKTKNSVQDVLTQSFKIFSMN